MSYRNGKRMRLVASLLGLLILLPVGGCYRGQPSEKPPIRVVPDMDEQPKILPQSASLFFADSAAMRKPVEGTVAQGWLSENSIYFTGLDPATGEAVLKSPVLPTLTGLQRGRERFDIYCSVCHSRVGDGKGILMERGYIPPPNFHSNLIRNYPDGHIFRVISNGIRNMPGYSQQIPVNDRWLIVNYLRVLQFSQNAALEDIPPEMRGRFK